MSLTGKLLSGLAKTSRASVLTQSKFFDKQALTKLSVAIMAAMCSGHLDGGPTAGSTMLVGDSRTFKTNICLYIISEYLRAFPDAVMIFVDAEFGAAARYFATFGIDTNRVIHIPVEDVEQMTFETVQILDKVEKGDRVIILIDSVSQVASKKEATDALEGNGTQDMTRARSLNSFWRVVNPKLNLKGIPLYAINSYYDDIGNKYAEKKIKGGKQGFLSADAVWFVTREQEKDKDKDLIGYTFNYRAMKSRFVKEGSKFPVTVTFDGGIDRYSGIWDLCKEFGLITMVSNGWYVADPRLGLNLTVKTQRVDLETDEHMKKIVESEVFREAVKNHYILSDSNMFASDDEKIDEETGEIIPNA